MPAADRARRTARAFGLEIDASFPAPGLPAAGPGPPGRPTRADLVTPEEIDRGWPDGGAERVLEEWFDRDTPDRTIDAHPQAGYRLYARHFGLARLSRGGDRIECSPPEGLEDWSWQRFLIGRVLPWAAVLRGLEAFHASAVELGGRAIAFVAPTGGGKTSLAIRLAARGASFMTDDVLVVEARCGGVLLAHPGASIAGVRPAERDTIPAATWSALGPELGHSGKTYVELARTDAALPLAAVYFLRAGEAPGIAPVERPDPRVLLASTFVLGVRTPERLRTQLDVCARMARSVPLFSLAIAPGVGAEVAAAMVEEHAHELAGRA